MLAALISRRIGATSQLAKFRPIRIEAIRMVRAITANINAKLTWMPSLRDSIAAYSATLAWVSLSWVTTRGSSSRAT